MQLCLQLGLFHGCLTAWWLGLQGPGRRHLDLIFKVIWCLLSCSHRPAKIQGEDRDPTPRGMSIRSRRKKGCVVSRSDAVVTGKCNWTHTPPSSAHRAFAPSVSTTCNTPPPLSLIKSYSFLISQLSHFFQASLPELPDQVSLA